MVHQDVTRETHNKIMKDLEEKLSTTLNMKKFQQNLSLGDILTVWQRVMSKVMSGG